MFFSVHCAQCFVNRVTINSVSNMILKLQKNRLRNLEYICRAFAYRQTSTVSSTTARNPAIMKLNSPEFYSIFTPELKKLDSIFNKHGYELRIVGGAVRDLLLGERPSDLDFATTATPDEMKKIFTTENIRMLPKKGEKHGTVTPRIDDRANFEITSLRTDLYCDGRHAEVLFITDWEKDAARRDLTINALYLGLDGTVYDYVNGYDDLMNRRVAFVGNPDMRMEEDFLRILRYFRFFGRISQNPDAHDEETLKAIQRKGYGLAKISGERIWCELNRILQGNMKKELFEIMMDLQLTQYMGLDVPDQLDKACFRTACQRDSKYPLKPMTLIASLLNEEKQVLKFYSRMKLSSYERDLAFFIFYHKSENPSLSIAEKFNSLKYLMACTNLSEKQMREFIVELLRFKDDEELLNLFQAWELPPFPITGKMIKEATKIRDPKKISTILQRLKQLWAESDYQMKEDDLCKELNNMRQGNIAN